MRNGRRFVTGKQKGPASEKEGGALNRRWISSESDLKDQRVIHDDLGDTTGTNSTYLTDETEARLHGDRLDQLDGDLGGVARHDHVGALGE